MPSAASSDAISASFKLIRRTIFMLVAAGEAGAAHARILIIIAVSFFGARAGAQAAVGGGGHDQTRLYSERVFSGRTTGSLARARSARTGPCP